MKNKFTLGVVSGMSTLALAVPVLAQVSSAASAGATTSTGTTTSAPARTKPAATKENIQSMIDRDNAFLSNIDAAVTLEKSTTQTHIAALSAAATIDDDTAREEAVRKANDDQHTAMEAAIAANPDLKGAMMPMGFGFGGHGGPGHGRAPLADIATKLGMTETELKAELDGGETIEGIATEKGVTLPARPTGGPRGFMHDRDEDTNNDSSLAPATSSATSSL